MKLGGRWSSWVGALLVLLLGGGALRGDDAAPAPVVGVGTVTASGINRPPFAASEPEAAAQPVVFPFTIQGDRFYRNGVPVFLNMISYQPLEPGQEVDGEIHLARIQDDLRRLHAYQGGTDPILLRVYAQPTAQFPNRMPKAFYDGMRALDFWIVRDIYFDSDFVAADAVARGKASIDRVIAEVEAAGAFDRIFAWEVGNEFAADGSDIPVLESFLAQMCDHIKARMAEPGRESFSRWVTWASWPRSDPLRTDGNPISVPALDYASFNAYSYDPERIRDQQSGPVTGTPYAGYLAALKALFPTKPLVVSESGLPDSPAAVGLDQPRLPPLAPNYRRGALTPEQASEGIVDRYWDARLSGAVAGFGIFEWNDEWWKAGHPAIQSSDPEEHFGLARFATAPILLRFKLQQEVMRELLTMRLPSAVPVLTGVTAESTSLPPAGTTAVHAQVAPAAVPSVRFRWEASRGRIAGDGQTVQFHAGGRALGPAVVTAVAMDALGNATRASVTIDIRPDSPGSIEILTFGPDGSSAGRASGRVTNVDLTQNKVVLYVHTDKYYVQPYADMRSIWVENDGYWWSTSHASQSDAPSLYAWVVPISFDPPLTMDSPPNGALAGAVQTVFNDNDNDLLPDPFEPDPCKDRYDDPDGDGSTNLEELLNGTNPGLADNDSDGDGLPDTWERRYFGSLAYGFDDDPDEDGLSDGVELDIGTHPGRKNFDSDRDGLPDSWERRRFGDLSPGPWGVDGDGVTNQDAYELGFTPGQDFFTLTPCRVFDTRDPDGLLGGPALQAAGSPPRSFPVTASACGIPLTARAISINITVDQPAAAGYLELFRGNAAAPPTCTINFQQGQTRANNGILQLATDFSGTILGTIRVLNCAPGPVHLILDVNGYFQ